MAELGVPGRRSGYVTGVERFHGSDIAMAELLFQVGIQIVI